MTLLTMLSLGALWVFLASMAAWGSYHFARHDPRSIVGTLAGM
jgi:hypothetical protein